MKSKLRITIGLAVILSTWLGINAAETKMKDAELYATGSVFIIGKPVEKQLPDGRTLLGYTREDTVIESCYEPTVTFNATNKVWEIRFK